VRISKRCAAGFTLLEVLVALVIVGLGMIAVFGQVSQTLTATALMRDKTFATWVATDRITELRLAGEFPAVGDRSDELEMAGVRWAYTLKFSDVGVDDFRRVDVTVAFADEAERPLVEVSGFLRRVETRAGVSSTNWTPLDPNAALTDGQLQ
jgi:general secretion pathway protein I